MLNESYGDHGQEAARTLHSESLLSRGLVLLLSLKAALKWTFSNTWYRNSVR